MSGMVADKVALVTGAGGGIGRATALAFAREGARVVVADLDGAGGDETAREIEAAGGAGVLHVPGDVTNEKDVAALIAAALEEFGRLDCAYNNAGIEGGYGYIAETDAANLERIFDVNLKGVFHCLHAELPHMMAQGGGAIVNAASIAGIRGSLYIPLYSASKHAVVGLTRSTALEYASHGVRVNAVCPGLIDTRMLAAIRQANPGAGPSMTSTVPMQRLGQPEEVAEAVVWLCSDRASYITGHTLVIDGGKTVST